MSIVVRIEPFYHIYGRRQVLFQVEVASADVGVQAVAAGAGFLERTEQPVFVFAEGTGVDVAGTHGRVNVPVIGRIADFDVQIAEGQADDQIRRLGHCDQDTRTVVRRAARQFEFGVTVHVLEGERDVAAFLGAVAGGADGYFFAGASCHFIVART